MKTPSLSIQDTVGEPSLKGRDIVLISLHPWYFESGSNSKNIAKQLSLHNRVLYVNIPLKRKTYLPNKPDPKLRKHIDVIKNRQDTIKKISTNLWELYPANLIESINWIPSTRAFKTANYVNNRRFAKDIKQAIGKLGFTEFILFNDNDIYNGFHLKEFLNPSLYIYYLRDFLQGYSFWKKHTKILEPQLIKKADLVVANSEFLAEYAATINNRSYYIGQGCTLDVFNYDVRHKWPEDIKPGITTIGYIGALDSDRLDEKILIAIAKANPEWQLILVGPEDTTFSASQLHTLQNVHFLGKKPFSELASYVNAFDVCINPQLKNEITKGNYPLKIDEYLAIGKPVIATRTVAMKMFEDFVYLADQPSEYPELIQRALKENSTDTQLKRVSFARSHSWENSICELYKAINLNIKIPANTQ